VLSVLLFLALTLWSMDFLLSIEKLLGGAGSGRWWLGEVSETAKCCRLCKVAPQAWPAVMESWLCSDLVFSVQIFLTTTLYFSDFWKALRSFWVGQGVKDGGLVKQARQQSAAHYVRELLRHGLWS
jgi:hypothetical protein